MFSLADTGATYGSLEAFVSTSLLIVIVMYLSHRLTSISYPAELPRVREPAGKTRFSLKTRLSYFTDCEALFEEAYEKFSKKGKTCLLPGLGRDDITLPSSAIRWAISQPDNVLSNHAAFVKIDNIRWTLGAEKYVADPWPGLMVKRDVSRVLETIMISLNAELGVVFDEQFGKITDEWTDIELLGTMKRVISQGSSRFTVGLPLCRNEEYLEYSSKFCDQFVINAGTMGLIPSILRPIIGPIMALPSRYTIWKLKKCFKPLFDERMRMLERQSKDDDNEPQDILQMMLRHAQTDRKEDLNFETITRLLAMANLGSYHQTSIAVTNILFNIIDSDAEYNTISILREEVAQTIKEQGPTWSKARVSKMVHTDSVCRETLRVHSFGGRGIFRIVMVDNLRTEDGILLPKGAMISVLGQPAQCDEEVFSEPKKYDPFRFSRIRKAAETQSGETQADTEENKMGKPTNLTFVSTGPNHLAFGHGRQACPGRFLLDFELKMMIAYLVTNYDFEFPKEYAGKRPNGVWMAEALMPPSTGRIRVKRRKVSDE